MSEVKRYDPINSDGTCGMCVEEAGYGAYVEYSDYAALKADYLRIISAQDDKWRAQQARDSAELRRLCAERDKLREERDSFQRAGMRAMEERDAALAECERSRELLREIAESESRGVDWAGRIAAALAEINP